MRRPSGDVLLLFILLIARARIDTLAEWATLPTATLQTDVARLVGSWWPAAGLKLLADRQTSDPVTLTLVSLALGLFLVYLGVDALGGHLGPAVLQRVKLTLAGAIILVLVGGQTGLYIGLRHISGPAAYTHDGGVIQTEVTIQYLLAGVNPYAADYVNTPMAAWGTEYRTALYHYPYLPWTFLFSAPFYLLSNLAWGWFDQRFVYLLLFAATLYMAVKLAGSPGQQLATLLVLGLNPILASDVIFGQNDSFVLFWIVLGVLLLRWAERRRPGAGWPAFAPAMIAFGLACASKPTAWFLMPFVALYLVRRDAAGLPSRRGWVAAAGGWLRRSWPWLATFVLVVGPWFAWDPAALADDVWRWSAGTSATPYQIRGWGLSNFVLAWGLVADRLAYWPFWIVEVLLGGPLLAALLWQQWRANQLSRALYGYVVLLFGFFYVSRFLNENYLGYLLSLIALAAGLSPPAGGMPAGAEPAPAATPHSK